ncbi:tyrosine kinase [compost metagenome]
MQQTPALTSHDDDDDIDLMGLLGTLVDHKWLIAGITAASMAVGTAYAVLANPVYQATA